MAENLRPDKTGYGKLTFEIAYEEPHSGEKITTTRCFETIAEAEDWAIFNIGVAFTLKHMDGTEHSWAMASC